jgi:hypothetical protein
MSHTDGCYPALDVNGPIVERRGSRPVVPVNFRIRTSSVFFQQGESKLTVRSSWGTMTYDHPGALAERIIL